MSTSKSKPAAGAKTDAAKTAKPAKAAKSSKASSKDKVDDARLDTVSGGINSVAGGQLDYGK